MAKNFANETDAFLAVYRYLEGYDKVHDITSEYGVNTWRLYGAIDGEEWAGVLNSALKKLSVENPEAYSNLPISGKLRRSRFGMPIPPLPLFE